MSLYQKMSGMNDLVITKAGWVRIREVLSPKGKLSKGTQIKYKAWKDVWMILRKCGNYSELKAYPDSVKASSFTVEGYSLNYEDFCGFDIGEYDGFSQVLAIITTNVTYLLCPADKKDKDEWTENISQLFVDQGLFYVTVKKNCLIREGPAELRLLSTSVVLTGDTLPVCLGKWLISDIRRYGACKDCVFVFELSQRFEVDKKTIVKLTTTDADAIKKLFDEMARSSSVVGQKTHQPVTKPTKSFPSPQKQILAPTLTVPRQTKEIQQTPPVPMPRFKASVSPNRGLAYTEVEFVDSPIAKPLPLSEQTSNYTQVDIATTEALSKAIKQSELDNQKHAMELAKKLGPHYENNIMLTTQLYKFPADSEQSFDDSKMRRASEISFTFPEQLTDGKRRSSETPSRSMEESISSLQIEQRNTDETQLNGDYENVSININRNYENIVLNPFEQEK